MMSESGIAIAFCGINTLQPDSGMEWYIIKVPDPECDSYPFAKGKKEEVSTKNLLPFNIAKFYSYGNTTAIGSHLYDIGGVKDPTHLSPLDYYESRELWTLDLNRLSDGWKSGPPMTFHGRFTPPMVLDDKLYVLGGGFYFTFYDEFPSGGNGWIEVFDPSLQTWESLPNPPFNMLRSRHVMAALLKSKKQILVVVDQSHSEETLDYNSDSDDYSGGKHAKFHIYDVTTRGWTTLVPSAVSTLPQFLGRHDDVIDDSPPLLLHLHDQKFCILLQSFTDNIEYVNCLILEVSPIFNEFDENENENDDIDDDDRFWKLRISIVSIQKYPMDHRLLVFDFMHVAAVPLSARKATGGSAEGIAPFLQLPHFSEAVIKKIACKKVRTFQDLQDMSLQERAELLAQVAGFSPVEVQDVEMVLETMPSMAIEVTCETEGEDGIQEGDIVTVHA
uniref:Uncharacterized protein n=1 Tax=Fagus sylvatica TaxID=28930 RepID=A0A2N9H4T1_FAGSY